MQISFWFEFVISSNLNRLFAKNQWVGLKRCSIYLVEQFSQKNQ